MKKLIITTACILAALSASAQDLYDVGAPDSLQNRPRTHKVAATKSSRTGQPAMYGLPNTSTKFTAAQLSTMNPTVPLRIGADYLRKSANYDNIAIGCALSGAAAALVSATLDDLDSQRPCWYISGLFGAAALITKIVSVNYKLRASSAFSSVTITPTTIKLTF